MLKSLKNGEIYRVLVAVKSEPGTYRMICSWGKVGQYQGTMPYTGMSLLLSETGKEIATQRDAARCCLVPQTHDVFRPSDLHLTGRRLLGE